MVDDLIRSGSISPPGLACLNFSQVSVRCLAVVWGAVCSPSDMASGGGYQPWK